MEDELAGLRDAFTFLLEGQTLLHGGRFRFLRRIGSGTFAVILRALDLQTGHAVAIKCMQRPEYNAIGEQEAAILRLISARDPDANCAVVRILDTFMEQEFFCLVLEILGDAVLNVSLWGPWRQPHQERSLRSPSSARRHKLHSVVGTKASSSVQSLVSGSVSSSPSALRPRSASPVPVCPSISPLSLDDVRQITVHLCGALAFLHAQGLIHADLKPENIVRSPHNSSSTPALSAVKLIDFGNCIEKHKIPLYQARDIVKNDGAPNTQSNAGFEVQTLAYRAPEIAAGLEISCAIDMWSLGCVLLECVSGEPLFTTSPAVFGVENITGKETENEVVLRQIELLVNKGKPLSAVHEKYQAADCYSGLNKMLTKHRKQQQVVSAAFPSLSARLEVVVPGSSDSAAIQGHFHDFIKKLLDVDPDTRMTARGALLHPFVQSFFPFKLVFSSAIESVPQVKVMKVATSSPSLSSQCVKKASRVPQSSSKKHKRESEEEGFVVIKSRAKLQLPTNSKLETKTKQRLGGAATATARTGATAKKSSQSSSLRAALKLIPAMKKKT